MRIFSIMLIALAVLTALPLIAASRDGPPSVDNPPSITFDEISSTIHPIANFSDGDDPTPADISVAQQLPASRTAFSGPVLPEFVNVVMLEPRSSCASGIPGTSARSANHMPSVTSGF